MHATSQDGTERDEAGVEPGLRSTATAWLAESRSLLDASTRLVAAEARLAAVGMGVVLAGAVALAILSTAAWLAGGTALVLWLLDAELIQIEVFGLVAAVSLLGAITAYLAIRHYAGYLGFPATRQLLLGQPTGTDVDDAGAIGRREASGEGYDDRTSTAA